MAVYRGMMEMEMINRYDMLIDTRNTRGHRKKLRKTRCLRDIKKHSFPHRCIETWNDLKKEKVQTKTIHEIKAKLIN